MKTPQEIIDRHKDIHDELTREFYALVPEDRAIRQEHFDALHGANWQELERVLWINGDIPPLRPTVEDRLLNFEARIHELEQLV